MITMTLWGLGDLKEAVYTGKHIRRVSGIVHPRSFEMRGARRRHRHERVHAQACAQGHTTRPLRRRNSCKRTGTILRVEGRGRYDDPKLEASILS